MFLRILVQDRRLIKHPLRLKLSVRLSTYSQILFGAVGDSTAQEAFALFSINEP
jgi:hypothetical protein